MDLTKLEFHEIANEFPLIDKENELQELADDIRKHGLKEPLVLFEGKILDGRNRYNACKTAGRKLGPGDAVIFEEQYDGVDPVVFVVQKNILRRNLTVGQRAAVGFELKERLKKIPPHGGKHQSRGEASAKAAAASQTTIDNIQRYEHLEEKAPELAKEVKAGKRSLRGAVKQQREVEKATPEAVAVAGLTQEKALERIMEVCGRPFYNSIIEDQISGLRTTSEVAAFAKLGDKEMNDLRGPLVRSQMTLAKARKFLEDRSDNNGELVVDWEWTAREFISLKPEAKKAGEVKERCVKMLKTPRGWYRWTMELVEPPPENSNGEEEQ